MSILRSSAVIAFFTLITRLLGYVREILIAGRLGAGPAADAFYVAFRLPNIFRSLFAEGAFNAAFVPAISAKLAGQGQGEAKSFAESVFSVMFAVLLILTLAAQVFMPLLIYAMASGFGGGKFELTVFLTRVTFPYLLFISLVSLLGGFLNSMEKFASVAATPILLNATLITSLLFFGDMAATPAHALAFGVAMAGILQFCWLYFALSRAGICLRLRKPRFSPEIKLLLKKMAPAVVGSSAAQVNLLISTQIASYIPGAIAILNYAERISQLPLAVIGTALGTALLPVLSRQIRQNDMEEAYKSQNRALELAMFLSVPAALALMALAYPVILVLFQRGAFTHENAAAAATALAAFSAGIPAYVLIKIFAPCFFAHHDTATPVKIAFFCIALNVVSNLLLIKILGAAAIAVSISLSSWVNAFLLWRTLTRRGQFRMEAGGGTKYLKIIFSAASMALVLFFSSHALAPMLAGGETSRFLALLVMISTGGGVFFASAYFTGIFSILVDISAVSAKLGRRKK